MRRLAITLLLVLLAAGVYAASVDEITELVTDGHWHQADQEITTALRQSNLDFQTKQALLFQRDRMARIRLDFNKTRDQVLRQVRAMVPGVTDERFAAWEKSGAIENMDIDGTRWYFNNAAKNLFRISSEAHEMQIKLHPDTPQEDLCRPEDAEHVIAAYDKTGQSYNSPHSFRITYTLSVHPDAVPAGETIRAWLPFPHEGNRQKNIHLIATDPPRHVITGHNAPLSCAYLEKPAVAGQSTDFKVVFEYTSDAYYQPLDPARVTAVDQNDPALKPFLGEAPPQIVFDDEIKKLSQEIVGSETNPCVVARKLFEWSATHLPWASAREYSTIPSLPHYALTCGHGDCGIKTMTFMTLCRYNGIPAHWESGWTPAIVEDMHDWCEIYLPPYGWVPVDVTYGFTSCPDERGKWFYFGGIDADRLVLNTNFCQPVYPEKMFYRSEIVDFQRGEVEWRGGNLYFNQWSYDFHAEQIGGDKKVE